MAKTIAELQAQMRRYARELVAKQTKGTRKKRATKKNGRSSATRTFYFYEHGTRLVASYRASSEAIARKYFAKSFPFIKRFTVSTVRKEDNPASRLPQNRLTPVRFKVGNKTVTGKAKRVGQKVRIFVTPQTARKMNPMLHQYEAMLFAKHAPRNIRAAAIATTVRKASADIKKRKKEFLPLGEDPRKWKVLSIRRVS